MKWTDRVRKVMWDESGCSCCNTKRDYTYAEYFKELDKVTKLVKMISEIMPDIGKDLEKLFWKK